MKKILTAVISAFLVVACLCVTACSSKVEGKTYKYDSYEIVVETELDETSKQEILDTYSEMVAEVADNLFGKMSCEFKEDGTCVLVSNATQTYNYEQDGDKIHLYDVDDGEEEDEVSITLKGKKIIMKLELDDGEGYVVYVDITLK